MDTFEKTIGQVERELSAAFPDRLFCRAFTSGMIVRKLKRTGDLEVDTVKDAMERLILIGASDVLIQSTHMMNGEEYDRLRETILSYQDRFERIAFGKPALTEKEDYEALCKVLSEELLPKEEGQVQLLMGHGTRHYANAAYCQLEYMLHDLGRRDILIGTVEGYPGFEEILRRLEEKKAAGEQPKKVVLYPLLIVAGDHAKNDMAGEGEDSWRSRLIACGYEVTCSLRGLGEYKGVSEMFVSHAKEALAAAEGHTAGELPETK